MLKTNKKKNRMDILKFAKGFSKSEGLYLENLINDFDDEEKHRFLIEYKVKRRNPYLFSILTLFGFVGFAGIQRFYSRDYIMGILYFFTLGFLFIGSIFDLVSFFRITFASNIKAAEQTAFHIKDSAYRLSK